MKKILRRLGDSLLLLRRQWELTHDALNFFDEEWETKKVMHGDICCCPECETMRDWYELPSVKRTLAQALWGTV